MSIANLDEKSFKNLLKEHLSPSKAITSPEHLKGRAQKLTQIDRAFNSPGRHIFIFGDRGVGKTSLAQTAAYIHQHAGDNPITVGCDTGSTFYGVIKDIAHRTLHRKGAHNKRKTSESLKIGLPFISYSVQNGSENVSISDIKSLNEAVTLLKSVATIHSNGTVIVVDEFDQISDEGEKRKFADFIKQVSDQDVPVRFIFCGIGSSLDDLLGLHLSTTRYISAIELEQLSHDARWEIVNGAADALGVAVDKETTIRIGNISDGFPYYVHLLSEMLFWQMFEDQNVVSSNTIPHFQNAVKAAVQDIAPFLKKSYEKATQKYGNDYQEVLWAVANHPHLFRSTSEIYDTYLGIMSQLDREPLEKQKFYTRMNNLKSERHGHILKASRAGWYGFSENIVRGYVRLIAEQNGVQLNGDHLLSRVKNIS